MITVGEVKEPYFLMDFDGNRWTNADRNITHDGKTYIARGPVVQLFGFGQQGTRITKTEFGLRIADEAFAFRNQYENAYVNKKFELLYVPREGATPIQMSTGYCSYRTTVVDDKGRTIEIKFRNRLGRLDSVRIRLPNTANQIRFDEDDTCMDEAQEGFDLLWGGTRRE